MNWALAVLKSAFRQSDPKTLQFTNQDLIQRELTSIVEATNSVGKTPDRTLSRTLQDLRDQGFLKFQGRGKYQLKPLSMTLDPNIGQRKKSKGEKLICNILNDLGIDYQREKSFTDLKDKGLLRFDFLFQVQGRTIAIEFQGQQHYHPVDFFGGQKAFDDLQKRDQMKREYCEKNGIDLIYVNILHPEKARTMVAKTIFETLTGPVLRPLKRQNYKE